MGVKTFDKLLSVADSLVVVLFTHNLVLTRFNFISNILCCSATLFENVMKKQFIKHNFNICSNFDFIKQIIIFVFYNCYSNVIVI